MSSTYIIATAEQVAICLLPDASVGLEFMGVTKQFGLTEDTRLMLRIAPDEARRLADVLRRKADEAEARPVQPGNPIQDAPGSLQ